MEQLSLWCAAWVTIVSGRSFIVVQDGSMRLYLCVLLRQHPIITQGVCLQIGGNKFIDVYISELGMDRRIQIEALQPSVVADFNKDSRQAAAN